MKVAIFPGSFNPFHVGHADIVKRALQVFDKVIVARGSNPDKVYTDQEDLLFRSLVNSYVGLGDRVEVSYFDGLLSKYAKAMNATAIIKGLRNAQDLEYETTQQYWLEDLELTIPIYYVICDRSHRHISSSALRALKRITA